MNLPQKHHKFVTVNTLPVVMGILRSFGGLLILSLFFICNTGNTVGADIYRYKDANGVWRYTDNPTNLPPGSETFESESKGSQRVLEPGSLKPLKIDFPRRNAIESAAYATVAVKTTIGFGSGFFITNDGFIITNKHVLRGDENQRKTQEVNIDKFKAEVKKIENTFRTEEKEISDFKEHLKDVRKRIDSYSESSTRYKYLQQYKENIRRLRKWEKDYKKRKSEFNKQKDNISNTINNYTSNMTVADLSRTFTILLADNTELYAYLISESQDYDLALLKIDGYETDFLRPVDYRTIKWGTPVYAVGNPAKLRNSVAKGVISGFEGIYVKTDAKIYPGNSGGPLVTEDGKVLGINTLKKLTHKFEGLGFAIDIRVAIEEFKSVLGDRVSIE